jgi:hypothetical protein
MALLFLLPAQLPLQEAGNTGNRQGTEIDVKLGLSLT